MRTPLILVFAAVLAFASCETLEDNTPAMQGTIDSLFFRAGDVLGGRLPNNSISIQGVTQDQIMEVNFVPQGLGDYPFGLGSQHTATYQDENGVTYTTDHPNGAGTLTITRFWAGGESITADFNFLAISATNDSIVVSKGIIYNGIYGDDNLIGVDPPDDPNTFGASVNGVGFNPEDLDVSSSQSIVTTVATAANQSITVQVPVDAEPGTYELGTTGYGAGYTVDGAITVADSGTFTIVSNNTINQIMVVEFSFTAGEFEVTNGTMTVFY